MQFYLAPILLVISLGVVAGNIEDAHPLDVTQKVSNASDPIDSASPLQIGLVVFSGLVWLIGVNLLFEFHRRRTNKTIWDLFNPIKLNFLDFNGREWSILTTIVVITILFGYCAFFV